MSQIFSKSDGLYEMHMLRLGVFKFLLMYKITADGDCSHVFKRHLFLGRKVMTNLDIQKKRHYFVNIVKAMVFQVVMYGCESWTVKKAKR